MLITDRGGARNFREGARNELGTRDKPDRGPGYKVPKAEVLMLT